MTSKIPMLLSALAICLSILSLVFTAYQQYFKRPAISIFLASKMSLYYEHDGRLYMSIAVVIRNMGAQYASIRRVVGTVSSKALERSSPLHWVCFLKSSNIAQRGEGLRMFAEVDELADLLVVPGRTAMSKRIQFITTENFELTNGGYSLTLFVLEGLRKSPAAEARATFSVREEISGKILRADKDTHVVKSTVVIPLEMDL